MLNMILFFKTFLAKYKILRWQVNTNKSNHDWRINFSKFVYFDLHVICLKKSFAL